MWLWHYWSLVKQRNCWVTGLHGRKLRRCCRIVRIILDFILLLKQIGGGHRLLPSHTVVVSLLWFLLWQGLTWTFMHNRIRVDESLVGDGCCSVWAASRVRVATSYKFTAHAQIVIATNNTVSSRHTKLLWLLRLRVMLPGRQSGSSGCASEQKQGLDKWKGGSR